MSNKLLNKFKLINDSRLRLKEILTHKNIAVGQSDLPSLVEGVNALPDPDYTPDNWNGIEEKYLTEPTDYYKFPLDLDAIYEADVDKDNYSCVSIFAYDASTHRGTLPSDAITGGTAWKFSDSDELVVAATCPTHTFDESRDIELNGVKYRYIIVYNTVSAALTYATAAFRPDAIVLYKGSFGTFTFGNAASSPLYVEIKENVTLVSSIARTNGENFRLKTFICNATRTNFAANVFNSCRELKFIKCTSTLSSTGGNGWFSYLKDCWISFKEFRYASGNSTSFVDCLSHMTDCTIIVENIYGSLVGHTSHANSGFYQYFSQYISLQDNRNCRFKIGSIQNDWIAPGANYDLEFEIDYIGGNIFPGSVYWDPGISNHPEYWAVGSTSLENSKCKGIKIGTINGNIATGAFKNCNLVGEVKITGGTTAAPLSIGANAFERNYHLKSVDASEAKITSVGAAAFNRCYELNHLNLGNYVTSIGDDFIYECRNLRSFTLPTTQASIGTNTFRCCHLDSLTTGISLTSIEASAFRYLPLTNITLSEKITSIGEYAFADMPNLKTITLPKALATIPQYCFYGDYNLETINVYCDELTTINTYAFAYCTKLKTLKLPATYTIKENAFYFCHSLECLDIYADTILTTTSLAGASNVRFADDFSFNEISSLTLTNSNFTFDNILPFLKSLPTLTTTFTLLLTPTVDDVCTNSSYSFWRYVSQKYIREVENNLVYCEETDENAILIADYVSEKGYTIS